MKTDLTGRRLADRYVLESRLAAGGMAEVWRGRDEVLRRPVAVKVLHGHLGEDEELVARFRREAVTAARLSHPAVVRTFDAGVDEGTLFIVMELAEGPTLEGLLSAGPLPPDRAARIARGMLEGLAHAHAEGVVHRDVKPANVIVEADQVKVTDFGIAQAAFAAGDLTSTGQLLGTVAYLSPEQIDGERVDARADLYAAGAVLYEMLAGRPPFRADTPIATATLRLTETPPPPGALRAGVPRDLEAIAMRALKRDPDDRFQSAPEMIAALERSGSLHPLPPAPPPPAPQEPPGRPSVFRSWMLVPLLLLLFAVLAVGAGILVGRLELGGPLGVRPRPAEGRGSDEAPPIAVAGVAAYDPSPGDGQEHDDLAPNAADGDPETAWQTEGYESPDLGGIKEGVGLMIDLGEPRSVGAIAIQTPLPGWTFEVKGSADGSTFSGPLPDRDGNRSFVAEEVTEVEFVPIRYRYVLIWITELTSDGSRYRGAIAEVGFAGG